MTINNSVQKYDKDIGNNTEFSVHLLLDRIMPESKVLEVGPATGGMTKVLRNDKKCMVSIIEIDSEYYDMAIEHADEGFCGDFEEYLWKDVFQKHTYDYVIFADVLEHLSDPIKAITVAKDYLKEDGSLLISVPNIAHNSIIMQLINNQFIYQPTGLLDYSHIKHFTFLELEKLYSDAGYKPVYIDATYVGVGKNEFDVSYDSVDSTIAELLKHRPFGEVYQHICELKLESYFDSQGLVTENRVGSPEDAAKMIEKGKINISNYEVRNVPNYVFSNNEVVAALKLKVNDLYYALTSSRNETSYEKYWSNVRIQELENEIQSLKQNIAKQDARIRKLTPGYRQFNRIRESIPGRTIRFIKRKMKKIRRFVSKKMILQIPYFDEPLVSIVIPVYNQYDYTYRCIKSVIENSDAIPYEIIIGDDNSTDKTRNIKHYIHGVVVNKNMDQSGFVMNCNNASKVARGKYILFLNNDTKVKESWLSSLVELIENNPEIGIVGSKLIYPKGKLQEAGGIVWNDANAMNYGIRDNQSKPEYNYVKEVDYISGASLMIRRNLWQEVGGFETRYAPAYYEDTDLSFKVREAGYKVVYQPRSVVVHYEGVSNGTDKSTGLKAYQEINRKKFYEKWKNELDGHDKLPDRLFLSRDRSIGKKVVLFIDHYVPHIDQDAGSKSTFSYIKAFLKMGYSVKFIGDNYVKHEPYTTILQQMGVEVLYGDWYAYGWKNWLQQNGKYIDVVFANRPHITIKYIDYLMEYTDAHIIYYGHDLHYVREMRQYELTGDENLLRSADIMKSTEYGIMSKVDTIFYPSYVEIETITNKHPEYKDKARAIPVYVYDKPNESEMLSSIERKDLMFVGGFNHSPNADAVKWFVNEIFPLVLKRYPEIVFHIIGSGVGEDIKSLETDNIVVHGFVTDEELKAMYHKMRLVVVPLRYGAGMKGKVVEALYYQIPLVTTPIGAEGMPEAESVMIVKEAADELADVICNLYEDYDTLDSMSSKSKPYIEKYFSEEAAIGIIESVLKK